MPSAPNSEISYTLLADLPDAIPTIAKWYFNEWGHKQTGNSLEATCERIKGKLNRDKVPMHLLAISTCNVVGVAQLKRHEMEEYPDKEYWLGSVYVDTEARHRGVALELCLRISDLAISFGIQELYLQTEHLKGGVYSRAGWIPYEHTISRGDEVLVMVKKLGL